MNPVIDRTKLLKPLVSLMLFIFFYWLVVAKLHWDYTIWWIDMPMHFLGGFWESLLYIWFFSIPRMAAFFFLPFWELSLERLDLKFILKTILFVLFIGVLWEFFEFYANNYIGSDPFNVLDTTSDVFFDLAGGFSALLYILLLSRNRIMINKVNTVQ